MRRFLLLAVALVALNSAGLAYIAGRSPAPKTQHVPVEKLRVVAFSPTGDVADEDKQDRLTVVFDEPVVTKEQVGDRLSQVPFVIEPALAGHWSWTDRDKLAFALEAPLPAGRTYEVKPGPHALAALGRELVGETTFTFATRRLGVVDCELLSQDQTYATIRIAFNQRVSVGEVLDHLTVTRPGSEEPCAVAPVSDWLEDRSAESEGEADIVLRVARHARRSANGKNDQLLVRLKPGLAGDGATRGLVIAWEKRIELDPRLAFRSVYVPRPNLEEVMTVRLRFTRALDARQGRPDLTVSPPVEGLRATYSRSELRLAGRFQPGRRYTIDLGPGLRADNGEAMGEPVSVTAEVPDRRVRPGFCSVAWLPHADGQSAARSQGREPVGLGDRCQRLACAREQPVAPPARRAGRYDFACAAGRGVSGRAGAEHGWRFCVGPARGVGGWGRGAAGHLPCRGA